MIVVKIELHSAVTGEVSEIGRTYICNEGGTRLRGDYGVYVCRRGCQGKPREMTGGADTGVPAVRTGEVKNYPRLSYNVWRLVIRALKACFPEEK